MSQLLLAARLAARGIGAYRRRSIQTLLVVGMGVMLIVITDAFMQGFAADVMDRVLSASGHLSLTAPGYAAQREIVPIDLVIPDCRSLIGTLAEGARGAAGAAAARPGSREEPLIIAASILTGGLVTDGEKSATVSALGMDPWWNGSVVPPLRDVAHGIKGSFLPAGAPGMLLSQRVADKLGARTGDRLLFLCSDRYGSFGVVEVPLRGVFPRGAAMAGEECIIDLASMQYATGLEGGATEIMAWGQERRPSGLVLASPRMASAALDRSVSIAQERGLVAQRWNEISSSYASMMSFMDMYLGIMYAIFAIVASVGMANAILLSVQDRFRDIATLRVVALSREGVSAMIALESLFLGLVGAAAGAITGGAVAVALERAGITIGVELESVASYMGNGITARFFPARVAAIAFLSSLVPVLASILPIMTLRRVTVREAMGSV